MLLVLGVESPIHDPAALAARVRAARRDATIAVLDAAGHTVPVDAADRVAPLLGEFLDRDEIRPGP
jgi:pimeloyl-ACP methyl ester carboxylesterase